MTATITRPSSVKIQGKNYKLDPQVYYNHQGYCLVTLREVKQKTLPTKSGGEFNIMKLKFQFRGFDSMGSLTDQLTFTEDISSENLLNRGEPTLKSYIYDALNIKALPEFEIADLDGEAIADTSTDDFFAPMSDLSDEEAIEPLDEKYKMSNVLPDYIGKSFIAVLTRDNTSKNKYSNAGYLNLVPESIQPLPTNKQRKTPVLLAGAAGVSLIK